MWIIIDRGRFEYCMTLFLRQIICIVNAPYWNCMEVIHLDIIAQVNTLAHVYIDEKQRKCNETKLMTSWERSGNTRELSIMLLLDGPALDTVTVVVIELMWKLEPPKSSLSYSSNLIPCCLNQFETGNKNMLILNIRCYMPSFFFCLPLKTSMWSVHSRSLFLLSRKIIPLGPNSDGSNIDKCKVFDI